MRRYILFVIVLFFNNLNMFSQFSDCSGAIPVCETGNQDHQVNGIGTDDFNGNTQSGCLKTQNGSNINTIERNSIWFRYKAARSGQLGFNIIPGDPDEDWDFAVYGPNPTCGNLGEPVGGTCDSGTSISNYFSINPNDRGQTGAGTPPSQESADWYSPFINVIEGEEYLLLINSFEGSNNNFTLEWTGDLVNDGLGNPLDCSIVPGNLGIDQTVCEGTSITLDGTPENKNPPVDTYEWLLDTGSGFNTLTDETNAELSISNNTSGVYKVIVTDTDGNSGEDEVVITFLPPPTATQPGDLNSCDTDGNGSVSLDFQTDVTPSILNGQDRSEVKVSYYLSEMDAENNTNILPNPYVLNTFTKSTIWARVFNVALTDDLNCDNITSFNITFAESPMTTREDITIVDSSDNNSISINTNTIGNGNYEFALFNEEGTSMIRNYQTKPYFEQLEVGIYTIKIKDTNGCGTATLTVPILEFPKFFTPNGDGIKDIWFIKGATTDFFPKSSIHIFNRYGKILVKIPLGYGWNGVFNSKKLPSNDYWYSIQLEDKDGNIRNKTGHFTLLRH